MSLYAAIDLHSSNSVLAVMDGNGKAVCSADGPTICLVCSVIWNPIGKSWSAWRWSRPTTGTGWSMG